jgi:hypothetical protein
VYQARRFRHLSVRRGAVSGDLEEILCFAPRFTIATQSVQPVNLKLKDYDR